MSAPDSANTPVSTGSDAPAAPKRAHGDDDREARLEHLVTATGAVLYATAMTEGYPMTYISGNCHEVFGYTAAQWMEEPGFWPSRVHPDDLPGVFDLLSRAMDGRIVHHGYRFRHADGTWRWTRDGFRVLLENGVPVALMGSVVDVTELHEARSRVSQLNAALEAQNQTLEEQVAQRTAQLHARTAELEAAYEQLQSFSYSVSHDLRSPLRAINGYARLLRADYAEQLDESGRGMLERIAVGAERMGRLIDDLLSFSRVTQQLISRRIVVLDALAREVWATLEPEREGRRVALVIEELPLVSADPNLLKHVLANLLSNAIKFTRERAEARIHLGAFVRDGRRIIFLRDNGVGFDPRYAARMFEVFQRLHDGQSYEGTGVGLAIVERVIARHGGRVWAEGRVGEGAAIFFDLGE